VYINNTIEALHTATYVKNKTNCYGCDPLPRPEVYQEFTDLKVCADLNKLHSVGRVSEKLRRNSNVSRSPSSKI